MCPAMGDPGLYWSRVDCPGLSSPTTEAEVLVFCDRHTQTLCGPCISLAHCLSFSNHVIQIFLQWPAGQPPAGRLAIG